MQNKGKYIEQSIIEYDDSNVDVKSDVVCYSITCHTNTKNDNKCDNLIKKCDRTALINEYNYKDNDTQDKDKHIKQHIEHDENNIDGKSEAKPDSVFSRPAKIIIIGLIEKIELLFTSFKDDTVLDNRNSIPHSENHDENNLNIKTEVLSVSIIFLLTKDTTIVVIKK